MRGETATDRVDCAAKLFTLFFLLNLFNSALCGNFVLFILYCAFPSTDKGTVKEVNNHNFPNFALPKSMQNEQ